MLQRAMKVAEASTQRSRHGAVIAHGSRVLAVGVNARRVHPTQTEHPLLESTFHAEVAALRTLRSPVPHSELTLYVARIDRQGEPLLSRPCEACYTRFSDFRKVVWTGA